MSIKEKLNQAIGTAHPKGTLMLVQRIGEASLSNASEHGEQAFVFGLANGKTPVVLSLSSNRYYTLSWDEIITLSIDNGILELGAS